MFTPLNLSGWDRATYIRKRLSADYLRARLGQTTLGWSPPTALSLGNMYRVDTGGPSTHVLNLDLDHDPLAVEGWYTSEDDLPEWLQTAVARLRMIGVPPPEQRIAGVGYRMDTDVFWVYSPET